MTTKEVADRLVQMCRDGKVQEAKLELLTEETASLEAGEGMLPKETRGLHAIQLKEELFISMMEEFYGSAVSERL